MSAGPLVEHSTLNSTVTSIDQIWTYTTHYYQYNRPKGPVMAPLEIGLITITAVVVIGIAAGLIYLYRTHNRLLMRCSCTICKKAARKRRASSSISHRPLHTDDNSSIGSSVPNHPNLFSITDEPDEPAPGFDDGYFYDEIFERSAFVDARTNKSLQQLCSVSTAEDEELPDLLFRNGKY